MISDHTFCGLDDSLHLAGHTGIEFLGVISGDVGPDFFRNFSES